MGWQLALSELALASGAVAMLVAAYIVARRRSASGSHEFLLMAVAVAVWSLGNALEVASPSLEAKTLFAKLQYLGIASAPLAYYLFACRYSGVTVGGRRRLMLSLLPAATVLLCWTNEHHRLIWASTGLSNVGGVPSFVSTYGPWFWVHTAYCYALLAVAGARILRAQVEGRRPAGEVALQLVGVAAPWVANAAYLLGLRYLLPFDATAVAFGVGATAIAVSLVRYQSLEVVPVARARSFDNMDDAAFVLDSQNRIVDLNRAAADLLGLPPSTVLGQSAAHALAAHPMLLARLTGESEQLATTVVRGSDGAKRHDVKISRLIDRRGHTAGQLVVMRDSDGSARAEMARDAIYSISEAVNTVGDLAELYREIHLAVARLMPADNCYIATYDAASGAVTFVYIADEKAVRPLTRTGGRGITEYVLRTGLPLLAGQQQLAALVDDGSIGFPDCAPLPTSCVAVPLTHREETIGVLAVRSYDPGCSYAEEDLDTLRFVSEQIAMAISRKQAEDDLRRAHEELEERVRQRTAELARVNELLSAREERYRLLFNGTSDAVFVHEVSIDGYTGQIVEVNDAACKMLGYSRDELLAMTIQETMPADLRGGVAPKCEVLKKHGRFMFEREHLSKSGARISAEVNAQLFELDGKPVVLSVVRDITQRRRLQNQLMYRMELERLVASVSARLASLDSDQVDSAIDAALRDIGSFSQADRSYVFEFSPDGTTMSNTHEWCADGIEPQLPALQDIPVASMRWWCDRIAALESIQVFDLATMPDEAAAERELLQSQSIQSLLVVPLAAGERAIGFLGFDSVRQQRTWAEEDVRLLRTMADMMAAAIERRRANQALRASEERYRVLFNSLTDPVFVYAIDPDSRSATLATVNHAAAEVTGYTERQLLEMTPAQLYASGGTPLQQQPFVRGNRYLFEDALITQAGQHVPVQVTVAMLDLGMHPMMIAVARNMSEHQRLEQQLLQAQKMETVGRLAGGVAHDFNNLLTVISGHATFTMASLPEGSPAAADLRDLLAAVQRARDLTGQLLAFSRRQIIHVRPLDLNALVADLRKMLGRLIGEDVEFAATVGAEPVMVKGDRGQIEQVIFNLAVNARDAMPRGGSLTVSCTRASLTQAQAHRLGLPAAGDYAALAVSDTGTGMTDEVKSHLFEPFFTTKDVGRGTGLGLATAYGIVKQHGGHIHVQSQPGHGSTFTVYLPLAPEAQAPHTGVSGGASVEGGNETILLVEDDASVRRVTERMLRSLGYSVVTAPDGPAALSLIEANHQHIDLLLTDVVMPRMGGRELAHEVRLRRPGIAVLFVSGYTAGVIDELMMRDGEVHLLQKPFSQESLAQRLRQALDRRA